ncbi:MAG: hypothetical protein N2C13_04510, partial [Chloroflexota bacterium]
MDTSTLVWLVPLPPVVAFILIILFTNKNNRLSHTIAVSAAAISWLLSMLIFIRAIGMEHFGEGENIFANAIDWLPLGDGALQIGVLIDPLSALTLFFVGWTVLMIFVYCIGYHNFGQPKGDDDHAGLPPHGAQIKHGDH